MAKQSINLGTGELTGDGESIRSAFDKINDNFTETYNDIATNLANAFDGDYNSLSNKPVLFSGDYNDLTNQPTMLDLSTIDQSIIPDTDIAYDLGSATNRFKDLYLSGNTINLGSVSLSAAGGGLTVGQTVGTISSLSATTFDYALGPFTTGVSIISTFDDANLLEVGYVAPAFTPTLSGDSITGITSLDNGGIYPLGLGFGDNYFLQVGPVDPQNEPYVINTSASRLGETVPSVETTLHPNGVDVTYTATHTDVSGETLTVEYKLGRDQYGSAEITILSASQSGPFTADIKWSTGTWLVLDSDPTTLVWGSMAPGVGPFSAVPIYLGSNIGYSAPVAGGNDIETFIGSTTVPAPQTTSTLQVTQIINLGVSTAPPAIPVLGDIAIADGIIWDPVTTGKLTLVIYLGSWVQIAVAP